MRHLYLTGSEPALPVARLMEARRIAIARALFLVSLLVVAVPLRSQQVPAAASPTSSRPAPTRPTAASAAPSSSNDSYNLSAPSALRDAPASAQIGVLRKATNVDVIARDHGWTRVRIEGWVPDSVLTPADTTFRAGLSAADLRADPASARGKTVMWNVEFLALQTADPLRHGLADEEPYILARGPNAENALLYLAVPPSLMGTARALQPLAKITVAARVRDGRSEPVGIPILDIQTIRRTR